MFQPLQDFYLKLLTPVIRSPAKAALGSIGMIIGVFFLYGNFNAGQEFFTAIESQYGTVEVRAQGNLSIEEQQKITLEVSNIVSEIEGVNQL